jgi:hypothetical protein
MEQAMTSAGSYDSETVTLLRAILDDAWERLTFEQRARTQKSEVAMRILRLARQGERDPMREGASTSWRDQPVQVRPR